MSPGLSLITRPHASLPTHQGNTYLSVCEKLGPLNLSPQDIKTLAQAAEKLLLTSGMPQKKFEGNGKTFKATLFHSQNGTEIYFHEALSPEAKAAIKNKEKESKTSPKTKQFFKSVHVTFKDGQVSVENSGLLKYKLNNSQKDDNFKHELNILNIVKGLPQASHLQNSTTYQGRSAGEQCKKGLIYLDYYENGDLDDFLQNLSRPLTDQELMSITYDLLQGLKGLESLAVLHNDLKPGNILVGKNFNAVIADFEYALSKEDYQDAEKSRYFLQKKGTPLFLSPERLKYGFDEKKHPKPGLPSNAWGIGCILYFLWENNYPQFFYEIETFFIALKEFINNENAETAQQLESAQDAMYTRFDEMQKECKKQDSNNTVDGLIQRLTNPDVIERLDGPKSLAHFNLIENPHSVKKARIGSADH